MSLFIPFIEEADMAHVDSIIRFVWTTDTHLDPESVARTVSFEESITDCNDWLPNAYINTGDFGDNDDENVRLPFNRVRTMCKRPYYVATGNHDENEYSTPLGTTNYETLEGVEYWNQSAKFYSTFQLSSGDNSFKARCIFLDSNLYDDDPGGSTISIHHSPGDRTGVSSYSPGNGWWRMFGAEQLQFVTDTLAADTDSDCVFLFIHFPPAGATMTDYDSLADILQSDGRPACSFSGHVHPDAHADYSFTSADTQKTYLCYKAPASLESACWTRAEISFAGGAIVPTFTIKNFSNPGGWTISLPFALE